MLQQQGTHTDGHDPVISTRDWIMVKDKLNGND